MKPHDSSKNVKEFPLWSRWRLRLSVRDSTGPQATECIKAALHTAQWTPLDWAGCLHILYNLAKVSSKLLVVLLWV